MVDLVRFGVSIQKQLLDKFDKYIRKQNYKNRSEAIRDLIRTSLVEEEWSQDQDIAGGIVYVYNHHQRQLVNKILQVQHDFHNLIISSQHVHLDHHNCLEIVSVKGRANHVGNLYHRLKSMKGIKHIDIVKSTTGKI